LIDSGANVRLKDKNGDTALNIAIDNDNLDIVMLLRRAGAKAQIKKKSAPVKPIDDDEDEDEGHDTTPDVEDIIAEDDDLSPGEVDLED